MTFIRTTRSSSWLNWVIQLASAVKFFKTQERITPWLNILKKILRTRHQRFLIPEPKKRARFLSGQYSINSK